MPVRRHRPSARRTGGRSSARCATTGSRKARHPPALRRVRPSPSSSASSTSCASGPTAGWQSCMRRGSTSPGSTGVTPRTGSVGTVRSSCSSTSRRSTGSRPTRGDHPRPRVDLEERRRGCGGRRGTRLRRLRGRAARMSPREELMVPDPQFESYYGRQILKTPTWKSPDIPLYLFLGGLGGASAVLAEGAALTGRPALERVARVAAAGSAALGTVALIHDLGRPERFLSMLRVFKPTSPLSVGSFILAPFASFVGGRRRVPRHRTSAAGRPARRCRRRRAGATAGDLHRRPAGQHRRPGVARGASRAAVRLRRSALDGSGWPGHAGDAHRRVGAGSGNGRRGCRARDGRHGADDQAARHGGGAVRARTFRTADEGAATGS